ncbi:L,D-transpeptidase family protein [Martelella sp. HB161492]|uniref:L,D-transpeptidase family protein n=1 Tax=Martelella sp. HB161492 TaxID=2720726 RepID=UPI001FF039D9|nr:L,D-transpeptidase family protein [Martelella sp. HB161492]
MRIHLATRVSSLALALAVSAAFVPSSANALTLMDIIRGRSKEAERPVVNPTVPVITEEKKPVYVPKVQAPKYFTYKPEPLTQVAIKDIRDPVVTGSISADDQMIGPQPQAEVASISTDTPVQSDAGNAVEQTVAIPADDPRQALTTAKVRATKDVASALEDYYGNGGALLWVKDGAVTDQAKAVLDLFTKAQAVGLDPADYAVALPELSDLPEDGDANNQALMQFELALSARALDYASDAYRGRIIPDNISDYHDMDRKKIDFVAKLDALSTSDDQAAFLLDQNPHDAQFAALQRELKKLRHTEDGVEPIVFAPGTMIYPGKTDDQVSKLVKAIWRKSPTEFRNDHADVFAQYADEPVYSPELVALVKDFQSANHLSADGVVGPATIRALDVETNVEKIDKVVDAMERRRWLPDDLGARYVFINQPAFRVYYHDDHGQNFDMGVVVGSPTHQTNFFMDKIETVEFNPYWGIPRSIIINEYLPKLRANPAYFDQIGYEVSIGGKRISSASVNWAAAPMVDVRQPPGERNALGDLKILFPNSHAIYMHDTPQKEFFSRDMRALSHGCVRLSDPNKMAAAVLGVPVSDIEANIAGGENHQVDVPHQFPVYLTYFTAWPDANGEVQYYNDVYDRDMYLGRAISATTDVRETS